MKRKSLLEKLQSPKYIESLSEKRRKQLLFCSKVLSEKELSYISSIAVGYRIARERWIREHLPEDEQERYLQDKPLFTLFDNT